MISAAFAYYFQAASSADATTSIMSTSEQTIFLECIHDYLLPYAGLNILAMTFLVYYNWSYPEPSDCFTEPERKDLSQKSTPANSTACSKSVFKRKDE